MQKPNPKKMEMKGHPQFAVGRGNGELCFPRDDVPNNYTGYGDREYSWQENPSVSHPKPDVYRVETKGTWDVAFRLHENRSAVDWKYLLTQPEKDETESHPQFAGGNVTLVTTKDARERTVSEAKAQGKIGNGELCFPRDDVPNNYTRYGGSEYSWKQTPLFYIPNQMYIKLKPKVSSRIHIFQQPDYSCAISGLRGIWDVAFRLHENRSAVDWLVDDIHVIYLHYTNFDTPFTNRRRTPQT
ncbi:hypothetical protein Tco_1260209 [Tanacetum coccineum]